MLEISRHDALFRQSVPEVTARKRAIHALLAVDHQMIQTEYLPGPGVMPVVFWIIAEIFVFDDDVVTVLLVFGQLVDGIRDAVGFDDQKQRPIRAPDFEQPCFAEPAARIENRDVDEIVAVELATSSDLQDFLRSTKVALVSPLMFKRVSKGRPAQRRTLPHPQRPVG